MPNALTKFGQFCRDLRTVHNKTMGDQADAMHIDIAFISSIETGAKKPPSQYIEQFGNWLRLSPADQRALQRRNESTVVPFPMTKHVIKNSSSVRLFRKISRMNPEQIRGFGKYGKGENKDDG